MTRPASGQIESARGYIGRRDRALIDDAHHVVVAQHERLKVGGTASTADFMLGQVGRFGAVDEKRADR
jgi:hypothetical protein